MKKLRIRDSFLDYRNILRNKEPFYAADTLWGTTGFSSRGQLPELYWDALIEMNPEYTVYSHKTPIAWYVDGVWIVPHIRYSNTTSARQNKIRAAIGA